MVPYNAALRQLNFIDYLPGAQMYLSKKPPNDAMHEDETVLMACIDGRFESTGTRDEACCPQGFSSVVP